MFSLNACCKISAHSMTDKTYVISQSSVSHFYTQFCTNAEKSRDQIIRSKNSLLVKLKCTQKNALEYFIKWYPKVSQTQARARRKYSPMQRRLGRPSRFLFLLLAGGRGEPILLTSIPPTEQNMKNKGLIITRMARANRPSGVTVIGLFQVYNL